MKNLEIYRQRLEAEKESLTTELQGLGRQLQDGDWVAVTEDTDGFTADENENADVMEDFHERIGRLNVLERRYQEVNQALQRIVDGTFGICVISGLPIEEERLEADPSASTCIAHMSDGSVSEAL